MSDPVPSPSSHTTTDVFFNCHLQNCLVREMFLQSVLENSSRALSLKGVYSLFLYLGELPSLTSINQYRQDQALEYGDYSVDTYTYGHPGVL